MPPRPEAPPAARATRARLPLLLAASLALALAVGPAQADTQVRVVSFEYTASGQVSKQTQFPNTAALCLSTSYSYDSFGNRTSVSKSACAGASGDAISSAGTARTSTDTWTDPRFIATSTNALGHSESKTWDARFGVLTSLTGPNGLATNWDYDNFGRKTKETRSDGTYTTWQYQLCSATAANCPSSIGPHSTDWVLTEQSYNVNNTPAAPAKRSYYGNPPTG